MILIEVKYQFSKKTLKYLANILSIRIHDLHKAIQAKIEQIVNQVNDALTDLRNAVNKKIIPENKHPDK